LWPIGWALGACFAGAVVGLAGLTWAALALLHHPELPRGSTVSLHDFIGILQLVFATVAGAGALVVLTIAYRRQRVAEVTTAHDRTRVLNDRFIAIAAQLGHDQPAVRLAGVHAMAGLADEWEENRQTCIDVLCAYLRMPYEHDFPGEKPLAEQLALGAAREVRHTIIRVITAHLQPDHRRTPTAASWHGLKFDFTGAAFDGGDFSDAVFSGGTVSFSGAVFFGGAVSFSRAVFSGGTVSFSGARFFGKVDFSNARLDGGTVSFSGAAFFGGTVSFSRAVLSNGRVDFSGAEFSSGEVNFSGAEFCGGEVSFSGARFCGGEVSFFDARFCGGEVGFFDAEFSDGEVDFSWTADWSHPPKFDDWGDAPPQGVKLPVKTEP
jgi:hypothetical protein